MEHMNDQWHACPLACSGTPKPRANRPCHNEGENLDRIIDSVALRLGGESSSSIRFETDMLIEIHTLADPRVGNYQNLKDKSLDRAGRLFIAEGEYVTRRLLASDFPVESVFITQKHLAELQPLVPADVPLYVCDAAVMNGILGMKFHSGVLACGRRKPWAPLEQVVPNVPGPLTLMICPEITNVENIGAMIRIAAGLGATALVLGERCHDPFWRQSIRVSMGTIFRLPIYRSPDLLHDLVRLKREWNVDLAATVLEEGAQPLASAPRRERQGILFGSEPHGLDAATIALCDRRITIPMKLGTDSLNVAVAAGIIMYHFCGSNG